MAKDQYTGHEKQPALVPDQKEVIVVADHGAIELAAAKKDTLISPTDIRRLASARGRVRQAVLFTDEPRLYRGINHLAAGSAKRRNERIKSWTSIGFQVVLCPRGSQKDTEDGPKTKEMIDGYLKEYVNNIAGIYKGRERETRFIFVIADQDYLPITRRLHDVGFSVTAFITHECAFMDPMQAPHIEERVLLYEEGEKDTELHRLNTSVHQAFGGLWSRYHLDGHQKRFLDRLAASEAICPDCGERTEIGLWSTHGCNENRYRLVPILQTDEGPVKHPYLATEADIRTVLRHLESLGPKGLLEWILAQKAYGILPNTLTVILKRMRAIPWEAIDTALGVSALGEDPMELKEAEEHLSEDALRLGCELKLIQVQGDEVRASEGILDTLYEFRTEAEKRTAHHHIAHAVSMPGEGALTREDLHRRLFEADEEFVPHAEPDLRNDATAIMAWLQDAETNDVIHWLTNRKRGDLTKAERSAVHAMTGAGARNAVSDWVRTLQFVNEMLTMERSGLRIANAIAEHAGASMTAQAIRILLANGVLRHYPETDMYSRGSPSHKAFHLVPTGKHAA